jgi:hypothetical protein
MDECLVKAKCPTLFLTLLNAVTRAALLGDRAGRWEHAFAEHEATGELDKIATRAACLNLVLRPPDLLHDGHGSASVHDCNVS